MAEEDLRDGMLRSLDRIRATASKLESQLTELHNIVRFDHRSTGARERAATLETELAHLAAALREFRERFDGQPTEP